MPWKSDKILGGGIGVRGGNRRRINKQFLNACFTTYLYGVLFVCGLFVFASVQIEATPLSYENNIILSLPEIPTNEADEVIVWVKSLPTRGIIWNLGVPLDASMLSGNASIVDLENPSLVFKPLDKFDFSVNSPLECANASSFDTFELSYVVIFNETRAPEVNVEATICVVDIPDPPMLIANAIIAPSNDFINIGFSVIDLDDRLSIPNGVFSEYSFHDEHGNMAMESGIRFINTTNLGGVITTCAPSNTTIVPGNVYHQTQFCLYPDISHEPWDEVLSATALDRFGMESEPTTWGVKSHNIWGCVGGACFEFIQVNSSTQITTSKEFWITPHIDQVNVHNLVLSLEIKSIPENGVITACNGTSLEIGSVVYPNATNGFCVLFTPNKGYYNQLRIGDSIFATDMSNTLPVPITDVEENPYKTQFEFKFHPSEFGGYVENLYITVEKFVVENPMACVLTTDGILDMGCSSFIPENSQAGVQVFGSINPNHPLDFDIVILELPGSGDLYYNKFRNGSAIIGERVVTGDRVQSSEFDPFPQFIYKPATDFKNSIRFNVFPFTEYTFDDPSCTTSIRGCSSVYFRYKIVSRNNVDLASEIYKHNLFVFRESQGAIVCDKNSFGYWGLPCSSFGSEHNPFFADDDDDDGYLTEVFIAINYTCPVGGLCELPSEGDTVQIIITSLPEYGDLLLAESNDTHVWISEPVFIGEPFTISTELNKNPTAPSLIYIARENFFTYVNSSASGTVSTSVINGFSIQNQHGEYFRVCNGPYRTWGCPDKFKFYATIGGQRSNEGIYNLFIESAISPIELVVPESIKYKLGEPFYFNGTHSILLIDFDKDAYLISVQLLLGDGYIGSTSDLSGLATHNDESLACLSTTGCRDQVDLFGAPRDVARFLSGLFVVSDRVLYPRDEDGLYITITQKYPEGVNRLNAFALNDDADVHTEDAILMFSSEEADDDYEYERNPDDGDDYSDEDRDGLVNQDTMNKYDESTHLIIIYVLSAAYGGTIIVFITLYVRNMLKPSSEKND